MKRLSLADLVEHFHEHGGLHYSRHVQQEQKALLEQLLPALGRLHAKLDIHSSAAFVELAYLWTSDDLQWRIEDTQKGLEFLAQEAEETVQDNSKSNVVAGFLELRRPWRAAGGRSLSPYGTGKDFPAYGEFMLTMAKNLHALAPEQRTRYLSLAKLALEAELGTGAWFTSSLTGVQKLGLDAVEAYARTGFEWLKEWRSKQERPHYRTEAGREVSRSMWNFMLERKGIEEGVQKLREHLSQFGEVAAYMESNMFFLDARKLIEVTYKPASRMAIWQVFLEISKLAEQGNRIGYSLWEVVNSVLHSAKVEHEEDAVRFAQALKSNYVATLRRALESSNGKAEGGAAALLDRRNAEAIATHIYDTAFWESLSGVISESPVISSGGWVPDTAEAANSLLEAVKGESYEAEKRLLADNSHDIANRLGISQNVAVLDLGIGDGKKLAALLKGWVAAAQQANIAFVDSNSTIALEGWEGLVKGLEARLCNMHPDDRSFVFNGEIGSGKTATPVMITGIIEYFESLLQHPKYKEFVQANPDYITTCLGTTLCNSEPWKAGSLLNAIAGRQVLLGLHLYDGDDEALVADYDTPQNLAMARYYLRRQGVAEEDLDKFDHVVEVVKKRERLGNVDFGLLARLRTSTVVKEGQQVKSALRELGGGDVVNIGLSVKYTDEQARLWLESFGFRVVHSYYRGNTGLYMAERMQRTPEARM